MQLAFDFDVTPDWVPLYKPFGLTLMNLITDRGCRDCGGKAGGETGGANRHGIYNLCPGCAQLDACLDRAPMAGSGRHVSHWGDTHPADEHDGLIAAREKRRAAWYRTPAGKQLLEGKDL